MPETWAYEVGLDDRFLLSSLVHDSEDELARLALRRQRRLRAAVSSSCVLGGMTNPEPAEHRETPPRSIERSMPVANLRLRDQPAR